jgi:hypothetical protein
VISSSRRGAGQRVDGAALPGEAADDGVGPERAGGFCRRERARDIAPAADADDEDPRSGGDLLLRSPPLRGHIRVLQVRGGLT